MVTVNGLYDSGLSFVWIFSAASKKAFAFDVFCINKHNVLGPVPDFEPLRRLAKRLKSLSKFAVLVDFLKSYKSI